MARKVEKPKPQREEENDLEILHPEQTLTIAGEEVTVREYGFVEGLKLRPVAAPLLESLHQVVTGTGGASLESILDILAEHLYTTLELVATSIDRDMEWLDTLGEQDGDLLLMTWWSVNGPFLLRSVQKRRIAELVAERAENNPAPAGEISTPRSSPPGTTQTESATTQSGS